MPNISIAGADDQPSARAAADVATAVIQLHHGSLAAALTTAIGAVILIAGTGGELADAMFQIALDSIAAGRGMVAQHRAADAARPAAAP
jgi:hypothetical protein